MTTESDSETQQDETPISFALVLKCPLERVPEVKEAVRTVPGVEILYQRKSVERLEILEVRRGA